MTEILIIAVIIAVALIVGIVVVWRQQIKLVREAEWLNRNRTKQTPQKNIERLLYKSDVIEIDPKEFHQISGKNLRITVKKQQSTLTGSDPL